MLNRVIKKCWKLATSFWDVEITIKFIRHPLRRKIITTSLVAIPLAAISYYGLVHFTSTAPHDFSNDCFGCHFTIPQAGDPRPYQFVEPVKRLCMRCHANLNPVSHYVNGSTTYTYDPTLPVTDPRLLTCATCHDPHMAFYDPATGERTFLLRAGISGKPLCEKCHFAIDPNLGFFTHRPAMDRAHGFAGYDVIGTYTYTITDDHIHTLSWLKNPYTTVDRLSVECIGCHDDPSNPELTTPGSAAYMHGQDVQLSHAIGINYSDAALNDKEVRPEFDQRLMLFDGKLGCCTCHNPYKPQAPKLLRVGDTAHETFLCEACHKI